MEGGKNVVINEMDINEIVEDVIDNIETNKKK